MLVQLNLYLLKSAFKSSLDINERSVFTSTGILRKYYTSSLFKTQAFFNKENLTQNPFNKIFWKLWSRQYFDLHMTKFQSKMQQIQKIVQNSHPSDNELHDLTCWLWCKKYYLKYAGLDFKHGHLSIREKTALISCLRFAYVSLHSKWLYLLFLHTARLLFF